MYPIENFLSAKRGYRFGVPTSYNDFHIGTDFLIPTGVPVRAPYDGDIVKYASGPQGGNTIYYKPKHDNVIMRFLHLQRFAGTFSTVSAGMIMGYSGNTGNQTTGPHLHIDISKVKVDLNNPKNFIDPEKYDWVTHNKPMFLYKKANSNTLYIQSGEILIGIADPVAYNDLTTNFSAKIITLTDPDFAKFYVPAKAIIKT